LHLVCVSEENPVEFDGRSGILIGLQLTMKGFGRTNKVWGFIIINEHVAYGYLGNDIVGSREKLSNSASPVGESVCN